MNRRKTVFLNDSLRNEDRVFEVVAVPGHKGDSHVLPKRQLTEIYRWTIGQNVTALDRVTRLNNGSLVNAGILVRSLVLREVINIDGGIIDSHLFSIHAHHNAAGIDRVNHATPRRHFANTGIRSHVALHTSAH